MTRRSIDMHIVSSDHSTALACRFGVVWCENLSFDAIEQAMESSNVFPTFNNLSLLARLPSGRLRLTYNITG